MSKAVQISAAGWPVDIRLDPYLRQSFDLLRKKWVEVPRGQFDRTYSSNLLALGNDEILEYWEAAHRDSSTGSAFSVRGWYQTLYADSMCGKKVLDFGCGLGPDTIFFAGRGAHLTFVDIVETNVRFVERVCRAKGIIASFCYMEDLRSLRSLPNDFDYVYCCGSLINVPLEIARLEAQELLMHLTVGGRWLELAYPQARWEREGCLPFTEWGAQTDGGAPWMEWHDLRKVMFMLSPATFDTIVAIEFHNADFNWFDLIRRS
jgi:SAM-dependent methyltransferase